MPRGQHPNSKKALKDNQQPMNSERIAKASKTKAKTRAFREELNEELARLVVDKNGVEVTVKNAMSKKLIQSALSGNLKAYELIRDTIGEKPSENVNVTGVDIAASSARIKDMIAEVKNQ